MSSTSFPNPRAFWPAAVLCAVLAFAGCASLRGNRNLNAQPPSIDGMPLIRPTETRQLLPARSEGSLFNPASNSWSPWSEVTAQAVGDIVTVRVTISTNAEGSASTDLSRETEMEARIDSLFGKQMSLPGAQAAGAAAGAAASSTPQDLLKTSSKSNFKGDGDTKRTGKIVADVSCMVTQVTPNGNLAIHGSQSTLINHENSILTVDGVVRRTDISSDNVVTSDRIANSRIEITGRGVVSDKQKPGLGMRLFDWLWPF